MKEIKEKKEEEPREKEIKKEKYYIKIELRYFQFDYH